MSVFTFIGEALGLREKPGALPVSGLGIGVPMPIGDTRKNPTVVTACRTVARITAQIPLDSTSTQIRALLSRPNSWQTPYGFRHAVQYNASLFGNAFVRAIRASNGRIVSLGVLDSSRVHVNTDEVGEPVYESYDFNGRSRVFDKRDICHVRDGDTGHIVTPSRLESGGERVRILAAADRFITAAFDAGVALQYALESEEPVSAKRANAMVKAFQTAFSIKGGTRPHGVVVLGGSTLKKVPGPVIADSDVRAIRQDLQSETASLFSLPPFLVSGAGNVAYSNHTAQSQALYRDVAAPGATNIAEALAMFLNGPVTPRLEAFTYGDWLTVSKTLNTLCGGPVLSPDEGRAKFLRMPSIPDGDKLRTRREGETPEGPGDRAGEEPSDDGSTTPEPRK